MSALDPQDPPIAGTHGDMGADDAARRAELARYRLYATGLLAVVACGLVASKLYLPPIFEVKLLQAAFEAALVGGLADWFAVTAIFRRPMGLPIPHTAIVPRAKARIAEGLGVFVTKNFLDPNLLAERMKSVDPAASLSRWLVRPNVATALAERIAAGLPVLLKSVEDKDVRRFLGESLALSAARADLSPFAARVLRGLVDAGEHGPIIEALARLGQDLLARSDVAIMAEISARSSWWMPRMLDERLARSVTESLDNLLEELARPTSASRLQLDAQIEHLIHRLDYDPDTQVAFENWKRRLLSQPGTQAALAKSWDAIKAMLTPDERSGVDPAMIQFFERAILALGRGLAEDQAMSARLNRRLKAIALGALVPLRGAIGGFITDVVKAWDARTLTERIELSVAKDLQYIRVSGTLVGALVGSALFLANHFLFGG